MGIEKRERLGKVMRSEHMRMGRERERREIREGNGEENDVEGEAERFRAEGKEGKKGKKCKKEKIKEMRKGRDRRFG